MTCLRSLPVRNWWTLRVKVPTDPRALPQVALSQCLMGSAASSIVRPMVSCLANCLVRCMALGLLMAFGIGCPLAAPHLAQAEEWQASLYNEGLPTHLVAVDKKRQTFMFFEKKSPLKLKYTFPCTTGQLPGDKQALNDLRTPEGIYFVEYKIASGLDFKEYGGIAYTLNYPNPVDRLRGKTGHGIWIHSKGFGIEPLSTRGCVAIGLKEIDEVGPQLTPGTAVVLAEKMDETAQPRPDSSTANELRRLMQNWSNAWASRSVKMFDYYLPAEQGASVQVASVYQDFQSQDQRAGRAGVLGNLVRAALYGIQSFHRGCAPLVLAARQRPEVPHCWYGMDTTRSGYARRFSEGPACGRSALAAGQRCFLRSSAAPPAGYARSSA